MAPPGPDGERRLRGGGIYPHCSLINHECIPNAARFDFFDSPAAAAAPAAGPGAPSCSSSGSGGGSGTGGSSGYPSNAMVSIRAIHDLPAGTEVVQSYFPLNWDLEERQLQAQQVYGFHCSCPRCLTESQPGWRDATGGSGSGSEWGTDDGEGDEESMEEEEAGVAAAAAAGGGQQEAAAGGSGGAAGGHGGTGPLDPTYLQLFMLKYMCPVESCFGTMAAVLGTGVCECNVCGHRRSEAEFLADLETE